MRREPLVQRRLDGQRPQIAAVQPDDLAPGVDGDRQLGLVVRLDQRRHARFRRDARAASRSSAGVSAPTISSTASAPAATASRIW